MSSNRGASDELFDYLCNIIFISTRTAGAEQLSGTILRFSNLSAYFHILLGVVSPGLNLIEALWERSCVPPGCYCLKVPPWSQGRLF